MSKFLAERSARRDLNLLRQELRETRQRARLGGFFYPVAAGLAFAAADPQARIVQASAVVAGFLLLAVLRTLVPSAGEPTQREARRKLVTLWAIVLATTIAWGFFSAWTYVALPEPAPLVALLFSGAFGMALAHTFCMRALPAALAILCVMLPSLAVLWRGVAAAVGATWAIYTLYMLMVMRRSHREYHERLTLEEDLRQQRDLFERQSLLDGLTGLPNRREFTAVLDAAVERGRRGAHVSLLIVDVDHFKRINDTLGHLAGDACLVALAARLGEAFAGDGELCARLGGEEFGVVLRCDADVAYARAERLRVAFAQAPLAFDGQLHPLTVSIGSGSFDPARHDDGAALYRDVDAALYRAKQHGRNRVERAATAAATRTPLQPA